MRAAYVLSDRRVEIREIDRPALKENEVLVKVAVAGVCGSDLHLFRNAHPFRKPPAILGHEMAGVVVETGSAVTKFAVGDRVTMDPIVYCHQCGYCRSGHENLCDRKVVAGTPAWIGAFVEYDNVPEQALYKIGDNISFESASLIEPLSVGFHVLGLIGDAGHESLVILGAGAVGLLLLVAAKSAGYRDVYCSDPIAYNREVALKFGAAAVFDPLRVSVADEVLKCTGGRGADATVITATAKGIVSDAFSMTRKNGDICLLPMTTEETPVVFVDMVAKEQRLLGTNGETAEDFHNACRLINSGIDLSAMVTHRFPMTQTQEAMDLLDTRSQPAIKGACLS